MRSRTARLALSVTAWIALGASAFLAVDSFRQIGERRSALRGFEATARDATDALDAAHAGQRAYVAVNQDPADWFPRVTIYLQAAATSLDALRASARSTAARQALLEANAAMTEMATLDERARTSLVGDTAATVATVFVEAADAASKAVSNVDAARSAEQQAADTFEQTRQWWAFSGIGAAGALCAIVLAVLGFTAAAPGSGPAVRSSARPGDDSADAYYMDEPAVDDLGGHDLRSDDLRDDELRGDELGGTDLPRHRLQADDAAEPTNRLSLALDPAMDLTTDAGVDVRITAGDSRRASTTAPAAEVDQAESARPLRALLSLAEVCTAFGRVRQADEIQGLLRRAAESMNARGLIVWLGTSRGGPLRPVLAHGYGEQTLRRIPPIPRDADNAAATAYRLGEIQIVRSGPAGAQGAIIAPLLVADGCIGALTAEVREQGEQSEVVRALATIVAAQLAGLLQSAGEEPAEPADAGQAASGA